MCKPDWKQEAIRLREELAIANGRILLFEKDVYIPIKPIGEVELIKASSILLDVMEGMGDTDGAGIYLPDNFLKVYDKAEVMESRELKEVSAITYVAEKMDCDDFAAKLFGQFAGLVWTNVHALNWFLAEDCKFYFIEPQTGQLSQVLEGWQGSDIRFFLGR